VAALTSTHLPVIAISSGPKQKRDSMPARRGGSKPPSWSRWLRISKWSDTRVQMASDQQMERYEGDPWEEAIAPWLEARSSVSISEVLEKCLQKPHAL
jgi:hypothetical protein